DRECLRWSSGREAIHITSSVDTTSGYRTGCRRSADAAIVLVALLALYQAITPVVIVLRDPGRGASTGVIRRLHRVAIAAHLRTPVSAKSFPSPRSQRLRTRRT